MWDGKLLTKIRRLKKKLIGYERVIKEIDKINKEKEMIESLVKEKI